MRSPPDVRVGADHDEASRAAAAFVARVGAESVRAGGRFFLALSGGKTPRRAYEALASLDVEWSRTHVLWADERCVPPTDPRSNFHLAEATLLARVGVPAAHTQRMLGEREPRQAARAYEDIVSAASPVDAAVLGVGEDGHTASLFPFDPVLATARSVAAVMAPPSYDPRARITLTLPALRSVRHVVFLVTGAAKTAILSRLFGDPDASALVYPAAMIGGSASTTWFVDRDAWSGVAG